MPGRMLSPVPPAANDPEPEPAHSLDDACSEAGYDASCRDRHGRLCRFHDEYCHAPHYPCIDLLRHALAVSFLESLAARRR